MLLLTILFYIFIVVGIVHLIHFGLYLIGANLYDVHAFKANLSRKQKDKNYRPLVSVLVPAYNEEAVVERCLQSVWNNTYSNIEITIINDGSTDGTAAAVERFIASRSKSYRKVAPKIIRTKNGLTRQWRRGNLPINRRIRLINQRNSGKAVALNNALRSQARGELIMMLDADSILHRKAVANVIKYFDDPTVAGVAANVRIIEKNRILGILQRFEHMVGYRSKKFFTLTNSELIVGGVASTYRRSILQKVKNYDTDTVTEDIGLSMKVAALGNKQNRLVYAVDVAAMTEGVSSFSALLRQRYRWKLGNMQNLVKYRSILFSTDSRYTKTLSWYRVPMAFIGEMLLLLEPLSLGYVLYLSIKYLDPGLIMGAYLSITAYLLLIIWPDEHMKISGKLKASLFAPFLYFIFYIMNVVQIVSAIRVIKNHKNVTNRSAGHTSWISPKRAGGTATFS